ncbi:hypothetical protein Tco_0630646 [Tanacetum coccineum]
MATIEQCSMLQAPIEGYEGCYSCSQINANNLELSNTLINLVQSNKFTGRQDPHNHLRFFNKVTSTFRHPEVPNTSVKLLLFPFSLDGEARDCSSPVKTSDNIEKFTDELAPLNSLPPGNDDSTLKKEFHEENFQVYSHPLFEFDESFKSSNDKVFKPGYTVNHAIHDKNLVTLEENLKENISSGTLLVFKEPSIFLPPPEPPDECLKNVVLNFYQSKKTFPLNVEDVNSFAFIIWTFLPFFTYTKTSPMIFSFQSENFVFDPGIITFHNPAAVSMKVSICSP